MKNVLLILSTSGTPGKVIDFAVALAKRESLGIVALYIIETELTNEMFDKFTDVGFIGDKPSMQLTEAVMKEYRQRGYEEIGKVQVSAMEEGIPFDAATVQGDFVERAMDAVGKYEAACAVVIKRRKKSFFKYLSRQVVDEFKKIAPIEVIVFEE